jgi:bifunctional UDP-N-acetylglucosamine pyrophosphorylase/glucosamine-1-phosphate N-acetyltransferase
MSFVRIKDTMFTGIVNDEIVLIFWYISMMEQAEIVILAAGHGKRMQSELPKALTPLRGKPLLVHVLEAVRASGAASEPIIVIGQKRDQIREALGAERRYAVQEEQLGTGHAVLSAKHAIRPEATSVLVLNADNPLVSPETIRQLFTEREASGRKIVLGTVAIPDFDDWRKAFLGFGRIKRSALGEIEAIVENKDATDEEKAILELNPTFLCFEKDWLMASLAKLGNENTQNEYYLTDLIKMAFLENEKIPSVPVSPKEALGINSREDLEIAESVAH